MKAVVLAASLGMLAGFVLGLIISNDACHMYAIQHHYAHYDSQTARFTWGPVTGPVQE